MELPERRGRWKKITKKGKMKRKVLNRSLVLFGIRCELKAHCSGNDINTSQIPNTTYKQQYVI